MTYRDFLEFIVLPSKKEKLRQKVLRRSGLRPDQKPKKKKKLIDDGKSVSAVSGISSTQDQESDNSVERRKEEEQAKISVDFAMAQIFE